MVCTPRVCLVSMELQLFQSIKTTVVKEILPVSTGISPEEFACFTHYFTPTHQLLLHHIMKTKADKQEYTKNEKPNQ
jgi:hypothetical protein